MWPPANWLEAPKGKRAGQRSSRINQRWRLCCIWNEGPIENVEIDDYHYHCGVVMTELANIYPGQVLLEKFLKPMKLSQTRLTNVIGVPLRRVKEIVLAKRAVSADTAGQTREVLRYQ